MHTCIPPLSFPSSPLLSLLSAGRADEGKQGQPTNQPSPHAVSTREGALTPSPSLFTLCCLASCLPLLCGTPSLSSSLSRELEWRIATRALPSGLVSLLGAYLSTISDCQAPTWNLLRQFTAASTTNLFPGGAQRYAHLLFASSI